MLERVNTPIPPARADSRPSLKADPQETIIIKSEKLPGLSFEVSSNPNHKNWGAVIWHNPGTGNRKALLDFDNDATKPSPATIKRLEAEFAQGNLQALIDFFNSGKVSGTLQKTARLIAVYGLPQIPEHVPADEKPYGAARLEDTDLQSLESSLIRQLRQHGLVSRDRSPIIALFPSQGKEAPGTTDEFVIGQRPDENIINLNYLNKNFAREPACSSDHLARMIPDKQDRIFAALHETAHYVGMMTKMPSGITLADNVIRYVNFITGDKTLEQHHADLQANLPAEYKISFEDIRERRLERSAYLRDKKEFEKLYVFENTQAQIEERIADTSAQLYVLSNYHGHGDFIERWNDYRVSADYDRDHQTHSSMQAASAYYNRMIADPAQRNKVQHLSIVDATKLAAEIITNQPEFNQPISQMAEDFRHRDAVSDRVDVTQIPSWAGLVPKVEHQWDRVMEPTETAKVDADANHIKNARNRLCLKPN